MQWPQYRTWCTEGTNMHLGDVNLALVLNVSARLFCFQVTVYLLVINKYEMEKSYFEPT